MLWLTENTTAATIEPHLAAATPASDVINSSDDVSKESTNGEEAVSLPHIESGTLNYANTKRAWLWIRTYLT